MGNDPSTNQVLKEVIESYAAKSPKPPPPKPKAPSKLGPEPDPLTELEEIEELIEAERELLRRSEEKLAKAKAPAAKAKLSEFVKQAWEQIHPGERLEWNWHLDTIADHCEALARSLLKSRDDPSYEMPDHNLLINVPPRSLKSEIVGIFFIPWLWVQDPSLKIRYMSGNDRVRRNVSIKARDIIGSKWYREAFGIGWSVRGDTDNIGQVENTCRGLLYFSTYDQRITGEGTDVILNDDPIDAGDAESDQVRINVNDRWDAAIENRVNSEKRCMRVTIMQRLHEDDFSGHVLRSGNWRHVCIPMEYEAELDCPCSDCQNGGVSFLGKYDKRTEEGQFLHPERFGPKQAKSKKKDPYFYAGQYQQRPADAEGGMFKKSWWGTYDAQRELPKFYRTFIFIDCAFKKTPTGSRTAMAVVGEFKNWRYILDMYVGRIDPPDMAKQALTFREKYPRSTIVIEEKAAGSSVITSLKESGVAGVVPWDPRNDSKEARAASVLGIVQAGDVLLPEFAPWKDGFIHELSIFPKGRFDDQVDVLTMALSYIRGERGLNRLKL